ncbi:hypothetical protein SBV1_410038 [Verrucomicrobia bacterium]|nr:hypothetical protein SBV1_410038 [Verrucomicrobiota bacterium]
MNIRLLRGQLAIAVQFPPQMILHGTISRQVAGRGATRREQPQPNNSNYKRHSHKPGLSAACLQRSPASC